jgi:hypothetical protein
VWSAHFRTDNQSAWLPHFGGKAGGRYHIDGKLLCITARLGARRPEWVKTRIRLFEA